mmetsp:Transcript_17242/g.55981  ORF Transcript_17242/g.55981 Transcript_17242/m.55981 type:complete len:782 (-) Transcript_17242:1161-3506(-)
MAFQPCGIRGRVCREYPTNTWSFGCHCQGIGDSLLVQDGQMDPGDSGDCRRQIRCCALKLSSVSSKQSHELFSVVLAGFGRFLLRLEPIHRAPYRSLRWILTGNKLRNEKRLQAAQRAYHRVSVSDVLDCCLGWGMEGVLGLGRVASLLGDVGAAQLHYTRALAVPTPVSALASGFTQSTAAHYRLGRLAFDGRRNQSEPKLSMLVAIFAQAAAMAQRAGMLKLHKYALRALCVVSHAFGIADSLTGLLLHASFICQFERGIKEIDRHLRNLSIADMQIIAQILLDSAHALNVDQAEGSFATAVRASHEWLHPGDFKASWVLIAICIAPTGHLVICRSTVAGEVVYCPQLSAQWPVVHRSMSHLVRDKMQQTMTRMVVEDSQHCESYIRTEAKRTWWSCRHVLQNELARILQELCLAIGDAIHLFSPRLIMRPRQLAQVGVIDNPSIHDHELAPEVESTGTLSTVSDVREEAVVMIGAALGIASSLALPQLRDQLVKLGLSPIGRKAQLVGRLSEGIQVALERKQTARVLQRVRHVRVGPVLLVLDKMLQEFPLEALHVLEAIPTSRIAHIGLVSGLKHARLECKGPMHKVPTKPCTHVIDPTRDLHMTRKRLGQKLEHHPWVWSGVMGIVPNPHAIVDALGRSGALLYCGHGNGAVYLPREGIRAGTLFSSSRALCDILDVHTSTSRTTVSGAVLLMGCSSGTSHSETLLRSLLFDYNCPNVIATLWDVTDGDLDRLTLDMLFRWARSSDVSTNAILPFARRACKLPLLNGAAVVCYGLP